MKELLFVVIILILSVFIWFFGQKNIDETKSSILVKETIANFTLNDVKINTDYLKNLPAYEQ